MKEILVTEEGYTQFYEKLEKLKIDRLNNAKSISEACNDAVGDGWHDNPAYEEAMRRGRMIEDNIQKMLYEQNNLKIVSNGEKKKDIVDVGDILIARLKYSDNSEDVERIKLTGKYMPNTDLNEISLNSPIGKAIYKKKIGDICSYSVNGVTISIIIQQKIEA